MSRDALVEMARRTLVHTRTDSAPLAAGVVEVPTSNYIDPGRWQTEIDQIWKRVPLVLGFSAELRNPGDYRALDAAGVPIVLIRNGDGAINAFFNSCSHRGAIVVDDGTGNARRFTCPYHAWSYDQDGVLVGILDREDFGPIDTSCHGLTPIPCEERAGLVFGILRPDAELDLDAFLVGYDEMLDHLGLSDCIAVGRQVIDGPNWKIAYDGYLDLYHLPILHKNSFGPTYPNKAAYDAWGPHQRAVQPAHLAPLLDKPEDEWTSDDLTRGVWTIFPHVSIAKFTAGVQMYMVSQLFPGSEPGSSYTVQNFLAASDPSPDQLIEIEERIAFLLGVVRDEDYYTGLRIQRAMHSGAKSHVLFGRNEEGGQRFHSWVDALVGADDAAAEALFKSAAMAKPD